MEAAVPPQFAEPFRGALVKLQSEAPPLPMAKVHRVLDAQLGTKWRERFEFFEDVRAFAKAFAGEDKFRVPAVVARAPKVIVSEWIAGRRLSAIIADGTPDERDAVCALLRESP